MGIFSFVKTGPKFKTKNNVSSFEKKLKSACRYGELKNLQDNIPAIIKIVKKYERHIRRGEFSYRQKIAARGQIQKLDRNLSKEDLREIDKRLENLRSNEVYEKRYFDKLSTRN